MSATIPLCSDGLYQKINFKANPVKLTINNHQRDGSTGSDRWIRTEIRGHLEGNLGRKRDLQSMTKKLTVTFTFSLFLLSSAYAQTEAFEFKRNGIFETYQANSQAGTLDVKVGGTSKRFDNLLGSDGGIYRGLVRFNGGPALFYETTASSTSFTVYYTLKIKGQVPVIDCLYGDIRNAQNGVSIRKSVCNLDAPLKADYQDLVYRYSDVWIRETNPVSFEPIMAEPSQPVDVLVGNLNDVQVALRYSSMDDLMSAAPSTWLTQAEHSHDLGKGSVYFVYDADGKTPLGLDVETDPIRHLLKRLDATAISALVADK